MIDRRLHPANIVTHDKQDVGLPGLALSGRGRNGPEHRQSQCECARTGQRGFSFRSFHRWISIGCNKGVHLLGSTLRVDVFKRPVASFFPARSQGLKGLRLPVRAAIDGIHPPARHTQLPPRPSVAARSRHLRSRHTRL